MLARRGFLEEHLQVVAGDCISRDVLLAWNVLCPEVEVVHSTEDMDASEQMHQDSVLAGPCRNHVHHCNDIALNFFVL